MRKKVFPQYKHGIPKPGDTVVFKEKSVNTIVFGQKRLVIERVEEAISGGEVVHFVGFNGVKEVIEEYYETYDLDLENKPPKKPVVYKLNEVECQIDYGIHIHDIDLEQG